MFNIFAWKDLIKNILMWEGIFFIIIMIALPIIYRNIDITIIINDEAKDVEISSDVNIEYVLSCNSSDSEAVVDCFMNQTIPFFKYNETDDSINLTNDELFNRGGDCYDWSKFYVKELARYDFSGEVNTFLMYADDEKSYYHAFATVYRNGTYCNIDQKNFDCYVLG